MALVACGDPDDPEPPPVAPKLIVEPNGGALAFDATVVGGVAQTVSFAIANEGTEKVDVTILIEGTDADLFSVTPADVELLPTGRRDISVGFAPARAGSLSAQLVLSSTDPNNAEVRFDLGAQVTGSCLSAMVDNSPFELGELRNVDVMGACMVTAISFDNGAFALNTEPMLPVAANGLSLRIRHAETRLPRPETRMTLEADDNSQITVTLRGAPPVRNCLEFESRKTVPAVPPGMSSTAEVTLTNGCEANLRIVDISFEPGPDSFVIFDAPNTPTVLALDEEAIVRVRYTPDAPNEGERRLLNVATNDIDNDFIQIELTARGQRQEPVIFPHELDLGDVPTSCRSRTGRVSIHNTGQGDFIVSRIALGDPSLELVRIETSTGGVARLPYEVDQGTPIAAYVRWSAATTDLASTITVHHDGPDGPTTIPVAGRIGTSSVSESFTGGPGAVDVLWVTDNTTSMTLELPNVAATGGLVAAASSDYKFAVTVLAPEAAQGALTACGMHPSVLPASYSNEATRGEALACLLDVTPNNDDGTEAGLRTARKAVAATYGTGPLADFLRDDARLALIFSSDANDRSPMAVETYLAYFVAAKNGHAGLVRAHAIAGPTQNDCMPTPQEAEPGSRYQQLANLTGGALHDICVRDPMPAGQAIATDLSAPRTSWPLRSAASANTIAVRVNGAVAPHTYDAATRMVRLSTPPAAGDAIEIGYQVDCSP